MTATDDSSRKHLERIARGGSLGLVGAIASAAGSFVVVVVMTNAYSQHDVGTLLSATSLLIVISALTSLGVDAGLGRFVMRFVVERRWQSIDLILRSSGGIVAVVSLVAGIGLWVLARPIAGWMALDPQSGPVVIRILAVAVPPTAISTWALAACRAFSSIRHTVLIERLFRSLGQLALIALCAAVGWGLAVLTGAWVATYILGAPLALMALWAVIRRRRPAEERPDLDNTAGVVRAFWIFTWPRSIAKVSQMIIQRADVVLVGAMISPSAAAIYGAATRFVPLGQLGLQSIQQVIQPRFTHLLAIDDRAALRDVFKATTAWNITLAWPIYLVVGGLPALYLSVFGKGYADSGVGVVLIMMVAMLIGVASGPVDTMLLMSGRSSQSLANSLVALVLDIGLCVLLIPLLGVTGAAVAWCAAISVRSTLGFLQVRAALGITPLSATAGIVCVVAVVCFGLPLGILSLTHQAQLVPAVVVFAAGVVAYAFAIWRMRRSLHLIALQSLLPRRLRGLLS